MKSIYFDSRFDMIPSLGVLAGLYEVSKQSKSTVKSLAIMYAFLPTYSSKISLALTRTFASDIFLLSKKCPYHTSYTSTILASSYLLVLPAPQERKK